MQKLSVSGKCTNILRTKIYEKPFFYHSVWRHVCKHSNFSTFMISPAKDKMQHCVGLFLSLLGTSNAARHMFMTQEWNLISVSRTSLFGVHLLAGVAVLLPLGDLFRGQQVLDDLAHQAVTVSEHTRTQRAVVLIHHPVTQPVKRGRLPERKIPEHQHQTWLLAQCARACAWVCRLFVCFWLLNRSLTTLVSEYSFRVCIVVWLAQLCFIVARNCFWTDCTGHVLAWNCHSARWYKRSTMSNCFAFSTLFRLEKCHYHCKRTPTHECTLTRFWTSTSQFVGPGATYLLQRTSRVGFCPISTRSQAGVTRRDDPRHSTRSLFCACSPAVVKTMCSSPSPKLMIVFIRYPSQSCQQFKTNCTFQPTTEFTGCLQSLQLP